MTSYTGVSAKLVFTNDCLAIMEPSKMCYKWCFVPMCTNTTFTTPEKTFLTMPRDVKIRKMWFKAARRDYSKITSSDFYCCEDHFDSKDRRPKISVENTPGSIYPVLKYFVFENMRICLNYRHSSKSELHKHKFTRLSQFDYKLILQSYFLLTDSILLYETTKFYKNLNMSVQFYIRTDRIETIV
ncbi:hypothetical protein RI129_007628 [Pyrocoelia pectoralis]|uniref:THAP-type domain-containing protein n=1 Tax=Pyrocoelia pectoralis TaxID=417401 RepID=A0AAN7VBI1_9COLE